METLIGKIKAEMDSFCKDAEAQIIKGNKAAGTRARKSALEVTKMMKDFRKASIEASKN